MFDVEQAADELDESTLNKHLSDDEIDEHARSYGTGVYIDDSGNVDIDRIRRHLEIVEADMRHYWDETVPKLEALPDSCTDDYVIFFSEHRHSFVTPIFEFEVDEEADEDVLVYLLGEIATKLRGRDDAWNDMILVLPDDVTLEDAEELVNL